jgi:hypothetical protein
MFLNIKRFDARPYAILSRIAEACSGARQRSDYSPKGPERGFSDGSRKRAERRSAEGFSLPYQGVVKAGVSGLEAAWEPKGSTLKIYLG